MPDFAVFVDEFGEKFEAVFLGDFENAALVGVGELAVVLAVGLEGVGERDCVFVSKLSENNLLHLGLNRRRFAHAELRPIQNVVDTSRCGRSLRVWRLRLNRLVDILESVAVRVFRRYVGKRADRTTYGDLIAFVAEPAKPKAQNTKSLSAAARGDDKSIRSQPCVREAPAFQNYHMAREGDGANIRPLPLL